jgi:hypothetical protein
VCRGLNSDGLKVLLLNHGRSIFQFAERHVESKICGFASSGPMEARCLQDGDREATIVGEAVVEMKPHIQINKVDL